MKTLFILSGAYVSAEFRGEVGDLPPAFLPVQNERLYVRQVEAMAKDFARIVIALPESFEIPEVDSGVLARHGLEVRRVDSDGSILDTLRSVLAEAISTLQSDFEFAVLHGDTYVRLRTGERSGVDAYAISSSAPEYNWAHAVEGDGQVESVYEAGSREPVADPTLCGFFSFASAHRVAELIDDATDFVSLLDAYARAYPVDLLAIDEWFDFGHIHTYFEARRRLTTERAFNSLAITNSEVRKWSTKDPLKLAAEASWFKNVPPKLRTFLPQFLGEFDNGYATEYMHLLPLSDLFVFGRLSAGTWGTIIESCGRFLAQARSVVSDAHVSETSLNGLYRDKLAVRLHQIRESGGHPVDMDLRFDGQRMPSIAEMSEHCLEILRHSEPTSAIMHGDFCFSNIVWDFRRREIKTFDPKGAVDGNSFSLVSDQRYDLFKLAHSSIGLYDHIVAGRLGGHLDSDGTVVLDEWHGQEVDLGFQTLSLAEEIGLNRRQVYAGMVLLFVTMVPLHYESPTRQSAFLANAVRLYRGGVIKS